MLGGHLDSWHAATGATDNAIGCAVMMEAVRILQAIGVKPRRTIRVALWGGEEQGLLGSQAYVEGALRHVREPEAGVREVRRLLQHRLRHRPRARHDRVRPAGGRGVAARGACARSRTSACWARWPTSSRRPGGTDTPRSTRRACPASASARIPIEYNTHTWHTNLDTYERIVEDDVKKSAIGRSRRRSTTWRCATRCCRGSQPARCRPRQGRGGGRTGTEVETFTNRSIGLSIYRSISGGCRRRSLRAIGL